MITAEELAGQLGVEVGDVQVIADQFPGLMPPDELSVGDGLTDAMVREIRDVLSPGDVRSIESLERNWYQRGT